MGSRAQLKKGMDYTGIVLIAYCVDAEGRFLLTKRSAQARDEEGKWECPGGGLKFGESPEEGLWRELREEVGFQHIEIITMLPAMSLIRETEEGTSHWIHLVSIIRVDAHEMVIGEPEMISDYGWYALDTLPTPINPGLEQDFTLHKSLLKKYIENNE